MEYHDALAAQAVFSRNDLGVLIFIAEKGHSKKAIVPPAVSAKFKETQSANKWSGHHLEDEWAAFHALGQEEGGLSPAALSSSLVHLGQKFSLTEVKKIVKDMDRVSDGSINFVEFARVLRARAKGVTPASIKDSLANLFAHYDRDNSGTLDATEFNKLLRSLSLKEYQVAELIEQCDTNKDGVLSFDELYNTISKASDPESASHTAWRLLNLWLQMSSGWVSSPKTPEELDSALKDPKTKVISFIRHGESEANYAADTKGTAKGIFNPGLTEKGKAQAESRRAKLAQEQYNFELIVVSPMKRTLATLAIALADHLEKGIPVIGHPIVREQFSESDDVGDLPATIKAEWPNYDWSLFPDTPAVWWYPGDNVTPEVLATLTVESQREKNLAEDWEEPWAEVMKRAEEFEDWLIARPENHICVVSHGGFIEALVGPRMANAQHCVLSL